MNSQRGEIAGIGFPKGLALRGSKETIKVGMQKLNLCKIPCSQVRRALRKVEEGREGVTGVKRTRIPGWGRLQRWLNHGRGWRG